MADKQRVVWIDIAKGIAILMVVCIHTDGAYLFGASAKVNSVTWWYLNVVNTICRVCVPIFFMLSGAVILGSPARSAIDRAYVRRLFRILIPLVIWALIYLVFTRMGSSRLPTLNDVLGILRGKANYHLWFLYAIAGIYLIAPLLNAYACATAEKGCRTLGVLWLTIVGGAWTIERLFDFTIDPNFTRVLPVYTGYFMLGYSFRRTRPIMTTKIVAAIVFIIGTVACAGLTRWISADNKPFNGVVGDYLNPIVMIMSIALYLLLLPGASAEEPAEERSSGLAIESSVETPLEMSTAATGTVESQTSLHPVEADRKSQGIIGILMGIPIWILIKLGQSSFGIYLSHVIFLETFNRYAIKENRLGFRALPIMLLVPIVTLIVTALSWGLTIVLSKIPVVRRIV